MISRRPLLLTGAALATTARLTPAQAQAASPPTQATERINLWPDQPPGGGGPDGPEHVDEKGAVSHIATPYMTIYRPEQPNGAAVLVAGGGGYKKIEMGSEAHPAALWLAAHGITAFTLTYRLPDEGWTDGPKAPLQDGQRAVRLIRARATQYGLTPDRTGVLGFSAGGHLMGLVSSWPDFHSYAPVDSADFLSAKPDNAALIYPVVTLEPPYQHTITRKIMVGEHPTPQISAEWSVQTHIRPGAPPMFLVQAKDDPISNPMNTVILDSACKHANVPVELHQLPSGGHGFGMGKPAQPSGEWPGWYATWLKREAMLG